MSEVRQQKRIMRRNNQREEENRERMMSWDLQQNIQKKKRVVNSV